MTSRLFGSGWTFGAALLLPLLAAGPALADFGSCVAGLADSAVKAGVDRDVASRAFDGLTQPDDKVLRFSQAQPEFVTPIWDYLAFLVDDQRIADGRAMMSKYGRVLQQAEQRYGVDRTVIAAVWGSRATTARRPAAISCRTPWPRWSAPVSGAPISGAAS